MFSSKRVETVSLLLECHPELLSPYTAYGGAIYAHTPLHLASRNGHRFVNLNFARNLSSPVCSRFYFEFEFPAQNCIPGFLQGSRGDDLEDGIRHKRADVARHRAARGGYLRKGRSASYLFTYTFLKFAYKVSVISAPLVAPRRNCRCRNHRNLGSKLLKDPVHK